MTASDYRAKAREILSGKWGMAILITLVAAILGGLATSASGSIQFENDVVDLKNLPDIIRTYLIVAASIGGVLGIIQFVIGGTVQLGYCKYLLKLHDGGDGEVKDLFSEFNRFGDGFILRLLTGLYVFLWSLLFVIPGIVAAYKYAMAPFIMAENPGMTANEAITASKEMMDGHKFELFCLELSFLGWSILTVFTLGIGSLWLNPYINMAFAAFYRNIGGFIPPAWQKPAFEPGEQSNPWQ